MRFQIRRELMHVLLASSSHQPVTCPTAGAEQTGAGRIVECHQYAWRQRDELAATGLAHQLRGNMQLALADRHGIARLQTERGKQAMFGEDGAGRRRACRYLSTIGIANPQLAAQWIRSV